MHVLQLTSECNTQKSIAIAWNALEVSWSPWIFADLDGAHEYNIYWENDRVFENIYMGILWISRNKSPQFSSWLSSFQISR